MQVIAPPPGQRRTFSKEQWDLLYGERQFGQGERRSGNEA